MADSNLIFLSVRGHKFVHVQGSYWRSWCRVCGAEYVANAGKLGVRSMPMKCRAHKLSDTPEMRHPNASSYASNFTWQDSDGQKWIAPSVRMENPLFLHDRIPTGNVTAPDLRQPSYAPNAVNVPAAPRVPKIEEADSDT